MYSIPLALRTRLSLSHLRNEGRNHHRHTSKHNEILLRTLYLRAGKLDPLEFAKRTLKSPQRCPRAIKEQ